MAHFAELDENSVVQRVIVVNNSDCVGDGTEEEVGVAFCHNLLGGTWKQTSYNGNIRKRYAEHGYRYDQELDAFIPPQPYPSWVLDTDANWKPPVPMPTEGMWRWDEATLSWIEITALEA